MNCELKNKLKISKKILIEHNKNHINQQEFSLRIIINPHEFHMKTNTQRPSYPKILAHKSKEEFSLLLDSKFNKMLHRCNLNHIQVVNKSHETFFLDNFDTIKPKSVNNFKKDCHNHLQWMNYIN